MWLLLIFAILLIVLMFGYIYSIDESFHDAAFVAYMAFVLLIIAFLLGILYESSNQTQNPQYLIEKKKTEIEHLQHELELLTTKK